IEPLQGGPYPDPSDDADIPNDMLAIVEWAAERSVMRFSSTGERDSLLPSPTEGQVCTTGAGTGLVVWVYKNSDWREIAPVGEPVAGILTNSNAQAIPSAATTPLEFSSANVSGGVTATSGNVGLTVPTAGFYMVSAHIRWVANGSGSRQIRLRKN